MDPNLCDLTDFEFKFADFWLGQVCNVSFVLRLVVIVGGLFGLFGFFGLFRFVVSVGGAFRRFGIADGAISGWKTSTRWEI